MGFREAVRSAFSKYFTVSGRASRAEFWWFFLFYSLTTAACVVIAAFLSVAGLTAPEDIGWVLLVILVLLPPYVTVTGRRLHDKGLTAWAILLVVVPLGQIAVLILCALPGDEGENAYGPAPQKQAQPPEQYAKSNIPRVEDND